MLQSHETGHSSTAVQSPRAFSDTEAASAASVAVFAGVGLISPQLVSRREDDLGGGGFWTVPTTFHATNVSASLETWGLTPDDDGSAHGNAPGCRGLLRTMNYAPRVGTHWTRKHGERKRWPLAEKTCYRVARRKYYRGWGADLNNTGWHGIRKRQWGTDYTRSSPAVQG